VYFSITLYCCFNVLYYTHHLHEIFYACVGNRLDALIWPPNGLRHRLVAPGQKRLCTTALTLQKAVYINK